MFNALLIEENDGAVTAAVQSVDEARLPAGNVTVAVEYSGINYKDGMIVAGVGGLVKRYPHVPGVDFAGTVLDSRHAGFLPGDRVVLTGWRVGEVQWGGLAQKAVVDGDWLIPLPPGLTPQQAMAVGTAGFTAMLAVMALEHHGLTPASGEVLVTGAAGGVGSIAVALLAKLGMQVVASTGRPETHEYLKALGATLIVDRAPFADAARRPLEGERWAACVDSVGGNTLARVLAQTRYRGSVAAVGLAGGAKLEHSVIPFLLRGINLLGIDSVMCPMPERSAAWERISRELSLPLLDSMTTVIPLRTVAEHAAAILKGQVRGRLVVDVNR